MLFKISKKANFAQASSELVNILTIDGNFLNLPVGDLARLCYQSNPRNGRIEIKNEFAVDDLSADKQRQLMLWKMQYSG